MLQYVLKLDFPITNKEDEYVDLIAVIILAKTLKAKNVKMCGNSKLIISQVNWEYELKEKIMIKYLPPIF